MWDDSMLSLLLSLPSPRHSPSLPQIFWSLSRISALSSCLPYTVSSPLWGDKTKMSSTSEPSDPFFCSLSDFTCGTPPPPARSNYCGSPEEAFPTDPKGCQGSNFFFFFPSSCSSAILTVIMLYSFKWFHGRRPCSSPRLEGFLWGGGDSC